MRFKVGDTVMNRAGDYGIVVEVDPEDKAYSVRHGNTDYCYMDHHLEPALPSLLENDNVNHPRHYTWGPVEVIEITEHLGFCLGNVVKYVLRADHKGQPLEDLKKAEFYLKREIANRESGKYGEGS